MPKMNKREQRAEAILRHGFRLLRLFPHAKAQGWGPVALYARLHRIEAEAHSFAERCCNEDIPEAKQTAKDASILKRLDAILGYKAAGVPVFLNGDPRGYALKIDDKWMTEHYDNVELNRDWGGYGILAPEF
jgi:hypothetical protein